MKNKIKRTSNVNKVALIALLGLAITNPWSVGYIGAGIDTAVVYFTLYSIYVFVASSVIAVGVIIYFMWANREPKMNLRETHRNQKTKNKNYKSSKLKLLED